MVCLPNLVAFVLLIVALLGFKSTSATEKAKVDRKAQLEERRKTMETMKNLFNEQLDVFEHQLQPDQKKSAKDVTEF